MMPHLVRDHVRLGEVARGSESARQLPVEAEVDVHALVGGTVERPHRRASAAAAGLRLVPEEDELRIAVSAQVLAPEPLRVVEGADGNFLQRGFILSPLFGLRSLRLRGRAIVSHEREEVLAENDAEDAEEEDSADAEAPAGDQAAPVLHVGSVVVAAEPHPDNLRRRRRAHNLSAGEQTFELLLRIRREAQRQFAIHLDDRAPHAAAVPGKPGDQLLAGETFRFLAPLGRDELLRTAGLFRQGAELCRGERLLDQVALFHRLLLAREKLPRLHAAGSAGLAVVADHALNLTGARTATDAKSSRRRPLLRQRPRRPRTGDLARPPCGPP